MKALGYCIIIIGITLLLWILVTYYKSTYYKITKNSCISIYHDLGKFGEYLIYRHLAKLEKSGAKFLFNCYLPMNDNRTTEIDVLMLYKNGIYVFESKNYSGWIFGDEKRKNWMQTLHPKGC